MAAPAMDCRPSPRLVEDEGRIGTYLNNSGKAKAITHIAAAARNTDVAFTMPSLTPSPLKAGRDAT